MWTMTEEEIMKSDKRLNELRRGGVRENLMAIIMDSSIGCHGCWEKAATDKAEAILQYLDTLTEDEISTETPTNEPPPTQEEKEIIICDGCNVNPPWEHRCHRGHSFVGGQATGKKCQCLECSEKPPELISSEDESTPKHIDDVQSESKQSTVEELTTRDYLEIYGWYEILKSLDYDNEKDIPVAEKVKKMLAPSSDTEIQKEFKEFVERSSKNPDMNRKVVRKENTTDTEKDKPFSEKIRRGCLKRYGFRYWCSESKCGYEDICKQEYEKTTDTEKEEKESIEENRRTGDMKIPNLISDWELWHILKTFDQPCSVVSGRKIKAMAKKHDIYRQRLINDAVHNGILYPKSIIPPHKYELTRYGIAIWYGVVPVRTSDKVKKKKRKVKT